MNYLIALLLIVPTIANAQKDSLKVVKDGKTYTVENPVSKDDERFVFVEQMPEFAGDLPRYLSEHVHYPDSAVSKGIEGRVMVKFVVDHTGRILEPEVVRSADPLLDAEALRVLSTMPAWKPGKQNGRAVNVYYTLPIYFRLENAKK